MLVGDNYYGVRVTTGGATTTAYFWVTLASAGALDGAAVTIYPTAAQPAYFNYRDNSVQWQAAAAQSVAAGTTVVTSASLVAGQLGVSPAQNVATTLTLLGAGGKPLGTVVVQPGESSADFSFTVSPSESLGADDAAALIQQSATRPKDQA